MKRIMAFLMTAIMFVSTAVASDTFTRNVSVLPAQAQQTIKKYFKSGVNHIKIDKKLLGSPEYDVVLNNGTEIEFNSDGEIKEIESGSGVPATLLPKAVSDYVSKNYKGNKIIKLDIQRNKYELELSNGVELEFDRSGKFLKVDR